MHPKVCDELTPLNTWVNHDRTMNCPVKVVTYSARPPRSLHHTFWRAARWGGSLVPLIVDRCVHRTIQSLSVP
jgi:hypothetical protein